MSRTFNRPKRPKPSCKRHPGVAAVKNGLCASCAHYAELGKKINAPELPKKAPPAVK